MCSEVEAESKMFGPLTFEEPNSETSKLYNETSCLLCDDIFNINVSFKLFLRHIFDVHHLVIEDVQHIENLEEYINYWKRRFSEVEISSIIPSVSVESPENKYFLLSSLMKEDKELRHKIKLEHTLKIQEFERTDANFKRKCLLCRFNFEGTRYDYLSHLSEHHNLQLGNPQNLVYIDELIENIGKKLEEHQCLYCQKVFPDIIILKEHMRKKIHKRINPSDNSYDKYYIVNYLEPDKSWNEIEKEGDMLPISGNQNSDEEYSDWNEKDDLITCLFCKVRDTNINKLCDHMLANHNFDFTTVTKELDFYQKIKLVNYLRRQIHYSRCIFCDVTVNDLEQLLSHMNIEKHFKLPETKTFNQPEYYFPTYENDAFLYLIEDVED